MNLKEVKAKCTGVSIATINLGNEYSLTDEVKWLIEQAEKVEMYEEALKEIARASNPSLKASCPRIAREALLKGEAEW